MVDRTETLAGTPFVSGLLEEYDDWDTVRCAHWRAVFFFFFGLCRDSAEHQMEMTNERGMLVFMRATLRFQH